MTSWQVLATAEYVRADKRGNCGVRMELKATRSGDSQPKRYRWVFEAFVYQDTGGQFTPVDEFSHRGRFGFWARWRLDRWLVRSGASRPLRRDVFKAIGDWESWHHVR